MSEFEEIKNILNDINARLIQIERYSIVKNFQKIKNHFFNTDTYKIVSLFCFILLIWFTYPLWMKFSFHLLPDFGLEVPEIENSEKAKIADKKSFGELFGTFGDSFGALNTLFSGFAFAGIIISIFLQSKELKATREEVQEQKKEFERQTKIFKKQAFENTFFQMLNLHNEIIKSINIVSSSKKKKI